MFGKLLKYYILGKLLGGSGAGRTGGKGGCGMGFGCLVLVLIVVVAIFAVRSCSGGAPVTDF